MVRCVCEAHLEEVILMDHAAVGQVLDQLVGQGGFPSVCNSETTTSNITRLIKACTVVQT